MHPATKILTATIAGLALAASLASPAGAPQMVAGALQTQRELGWEPCQPNITQLPADAPEDLAADAATIIPNGTCEIRFSHRLAAVDIDWVAWHEVCHLSTFEQVMRDPHRDIMDPAHRHPLFLACLNAGPDERGGY